MNSSPSSELSRRRLMTHAAKSMLGVGLLPSMEHLFSSKALAVGEGSAAARQIPTARNVIFLYMTGVIFILGAEINAALLKYRVREIINRSLEGRSAERQADEATDS